MKINYFSEFRRINVTTESLLNGGELPFWEVIFIQWAGNSTFIKSSYNNKDKWLFLRIKVYFLFLGKWTRYTPCFTKVNLIRTWQNLYRHTQRKNLFLTYSKNSRFYGPVSRRNSDWFLNLRIYQCRYDTEEETTFFSDISIYLRESSFLYVDDFQII